MELDGTPYDVFRLHGRQSNYRPADSAATHAVRMRRTVCCRPVPDAAKALPPNSLVTCRNCLRILDLERRASSPERQHANAQRSVKRARPPAATKPHGVFFERAVQPSPIVSDEVVEAVSIAGLILMRLVDHWSTDQLPEVGLRALELALAKLAPWDRRRVLMQRLLSLFKCHAAHTGSGEALEVLRVLGDLAGVLYRDQAYACVVDICKTILRVGDHHDHAVLLPYVAELLGYSYAQIQRYDLASLVWQAALSQHFDNVRARMKLLAAGDWLDRVLLSPHAKPLAEKIDETSAFLDPLGPEPITFRGQPEKMRTESDKEDAALSRDPRVIEIRRVGVEIKRPEQN